MIITILNKRFAAVLLLLVLSMLFMAVVEVNAMPASIAKHIKPALFNKKDDPRPSSTVKDPSSDKKHHQSKPSHSHHHHALVIGNDDTMDEMTGLMLEISPNTTDFWLRVALVFGLLLIAGLMAGLTIGLMALDSTHLHILKISGTPKERYYAGIVEPLRKKGHILLSTLLITNMLANETLPIILDDIFTGGWIAVVVSTALIVLFAEIIPQAVCAKHGLAVGAHAAWLVKLLMFVLYPITWPISKVLAYFLGEHHGTIYRRAELKELVALHGIDASGELDKDEVRIIKSVLDLKSKAVKDIMTPLNETFMLNMDNKLDNSSLQLIKSAGYSRVPIYLGDRSNVVGILLTKDLLGLSESRSVRELRYLMRPVTYFNSTDTLFQAMDKFLECKAHMAVVFKSINSTTPTLVTASSSKAKTAAELPILPSESSKVILSSDSSDSSEDSFTSSTSNNSSSDLLNESKIVGIVTFEDLFEAMLGEDIVDETDLFLSPKTKVQNPGMGFLKEVPRMSIRSTRKHKRSRMRRKSPKVPGKGTLSRRQKHDLSTERLHFGSLPAPSTIPIINTTSTTENDDTSPDTSPNR
eukprot:Partr_v1_DN27732_c1_g1_i1_m67843 putative domain-containing protein